MYLKVTGIIEIVLGAIAMIGGLGMVAIGGAVGALGASAGLDAATAGAATLISGALGIYLLISGIFNLIVGILGVKNSNQVNKAGVCFVLGVIMIVLAAIGLLLNLAGGFTLSTLVSGLIGCIIPVCYTYGASLNKKAAQGGVQ